MKKFKTSIFLFTRDLRIADNSGLIQASKDSEKIIPCFVFNPKLFSMHKKSSEFRMQFFRESLKDLDEQLRGKNSKLHLFSMNIEKFLSKVPSDFEVDAIFTNQDYSPYAIHKQNMIKKLSKKPFFVFHDLLLHDVNLIKTDKGSPYVIFSQYLNKAKKYPVPKPQKSIPKNFQNKRHESESKLEDVFGKSPIKNEIKGGRKQGLKILKNLHDLKNYSKERNFPALDATSRLSAHNKFGTCSIREVYNEIAEQLGQSHDLITEIHWRDFFSYIMFHFPYSFKKSFRKKYEKIPWSKNKKFFEKWSKGETGFPIVDAGMREMNSTGYMHNRVRMIVASFLTKDLHINWKQGERYFAKKLIDYDPCVNVGNWQWAASTGCDSQPWFRIFNPWLQQERYDSECEYIKKWIPEIADLEPKLIHKWYESEINSKYPKPIVNHSEESQHTKEIFKKMSNA